MSIKLYVTNFVVLFGLSALAPFIKAETALNLPNEQSNLTWSTSGQMIVRYEDESFDHRGPRERLRLILQYGGKISAQNWQLHTRVSTGLRNKQNVPAITLVKFNQQPQPDSDLYFDRLYVKYSPTWGNVTLGKQPWPLKNVTDTFWDRHLHPIGATYRTKNNQLTISYLQPLDGASATVGKLYLGQYFWETALNEQLVLQLRPWFVDFTGEDNAQFATRDTQYDHRSARLSIGLRYQRWQLGADLAHAFDIPEETGFEDSNQSVSMQLTYGGLKKVGDYHAHLRYVYTERFAVINEFAQNALAGFATTNIKGLDMRVRYKAMDRLWIGARFSDIDSISVSDKAGKRFRIELGLTM